MNNYLKEDKNQNPISQEDWEGTVFNVTLSTVPFMPWAFYFCYSLPEKTQNVWLTHFHTFKSFKDFEYAFMQNLLGNILTFMDVYEKSASAAKRNDFITVVWQLGRAIRRTLVFNSMMGEGSPIDNEQRPLVHQAHNKSVLRHLVGESDQDLETWRQFWSNANIHLARSASGFIEGLFNSLNSTQCGSRLVQFNDNLQILIQATEKDPIIYQVAALLSLGAFASFNCYFTTKEVATEISSKYMFGYNTLFYIDGYNFGHLLWYNNIYNSGSIFTSYRFIKRILTERINIR